jgi:hypothetical protein
MFSHGLGRFVPFAKPPVHDRYLREADDRCRSSRFQLSGICSKLNIRNVIVEDNAWASLPHSLSGCTLQMRRCAICGSG